LPTGTSLPDQLLSQQEGVLTLESPYAEAEGPVEPAQNHRIPTPNWIGPASPPFVQHHEGPRKVSQTTVLPGLAVPHPRRMNGRTQRSPLTTHGHRLGLEDVRDGLAPRR